MRASSAGCSDDVHLIHAGAAGAGLQKSGIRFFGGHRLRSVCAVSSAFKQGKGTCGVGDRLCAFGGSVFLFV